MASSRAGQATALILLPARWSRESRRSVSSIFGERGGAEEAERGQDRAPVARLWTIAHFDPVRACVHHDAAQESVRLVNRSGFAIHRRFPTGEKGIGVNHHATALKVGFEQHAGG